MSIRIYDHSVVDTNTLYGAGIRVKAVTPAPPGDIPASRVPAN